MKFLLPFALLAGGVLAQETTTPSVGPAIPTGPAGSCLADFIVTRCLETEMPKADDCPPNDYECLCAAHQAIATCYNNCPDDARAISAQSEVTSYCAKVTTSSSSMTTPTARMSSMETETRTSTENESRNTATFSADAPNETDESGAAGQMLVSSGSLLVAALAAFW